MAKPFFRETRAVQPRIVFGDAPCLKLSMDGYKTQRAIRFVASASSQISETKMVGQSPHYDRFTYRMAGKVYVNRIPAIRFSALQRVRHRIIAKIPASVPARHRHTFGGGEGLSPWSFMRQCGCQHSLRWWRMPPVVIAETIVGRRGGLARRAYCNRRAR